jgi:hypothetical protein
MGQLRFFGQEDVHIQLRRERGSSPRLLVPWWVRAVRRVSIRLGMRRQHHVSFSGRSSGPRLTGLYNSSRRSVVNSSFSRNRKKGAWAANARYLSRPDRSLQRRSRNRSGRAFYDRNGRGTQGTTATLMAWNRAFAKRVGTCLVWSVLRSEGGSGNRHALREVRT